MYISPPQECCCDYSDCCNYTCTQTSTIHTCLHADKHTSSLAHTASRHALWAALSLYLYAVQPRINACYACCACCADAKWKELTSYSHCFFIITVQYDTCNNFCYDNNGSQELTSQCCKFYTLCVARWDYARSHSHDSHVHAISSHSAHVMHSLTLTPWHNVLNSYYFYQIVTQIRVRATAYHWLAMNIVVCT